MQARIYRSIFRLDYQLSFKILDRLGEQLEQIISETDKEPFSDAKGDIDLANHAIRSKGNLAEGSYNLNLSIQSFDGSLECDKGYSIDRYCKSPFFEVADRICDGLDFKNFNKFKRVGFRTFILIQKDGLSFDALLDYFKSQNKIAVQEIVEPCFSSVNDFAITLESINEDSGSLRVSMGPYCERDSIKFFSAPPVVKEGLMLDIDCWDTKVSVPGLKVSALVQDSQGICNGIVENVGNTILKEIS